MARRGRLPLLALLAIAPALLTGCKGQHEPASSPPPPAPVTPAPAPAPDRPIEPFDRALVKSLRVKRSIVVRQAPSEEGKPIGTVAADTRVDWRAAAAGETQQCLRWIELVPRGWVCDRYLEPSKKAPDGAWLPKLPDGALVPGVYAKVVAEGARTYASLKDAEAGRAKRSLSGSVTVRQMGLGEARGATYWKTSTGEWIAASKLRLHEPSSFQGLHLSVDGAPTLPFAWVQAPRRPAEPVPVRAAADPKQKPTLALPARTIVPLLEASADGAFRRTPHGWIAVTDLRIADVAAPPPFLGKDERWIDVDLAQQVLVAWEGTTPRYATLFSSGTKKNPTPEGIFRIWLKMAETDMSGGMEDGDTPYSVATVPWTMFFAPDIAFHTAYWHNRFGEARSHGCVNLSPRDARFLYFWAVPDTPAGWSMAYGTFESPGSIVKVHSADVPEPTHQGYARRVYHAQLAASGGTPPGDTPGQRPEPTGGSTPSATTRTPTQN